MSECIASRKLRLRGEPWADSAWESQEDSSPASRKEKMREYVLANFEATVTKLEYREQYVFGFGPNVDVFMLKDVGLMHPKVGVSRYPVRVFSFGCVALLVGILTLLVNLHFSLGYISVVGGIVVAVGSVAITISVLLSGDANERDA